MSASTSLYLIKKVLVNSQYFKSYSSKYVLYRNIRFICQNVYLQNFSSFTSEQTALDVAEEWASANIYNLVKQKYDQAPKPKTDKKKGPPKPAPNRPLKIPHRMVILVNIII